MLRMPSCALFASNIACSSIRTFFQPLIAIGILLLATACSAAPLTVDGDLADWGFSVADNNASSFVPDAGLSLGGIFVEDSDDNAGDGGFVGPNYGGQNYDGEAMAVAVQNLNLFVAIVSGQRPDNGLARFGPGDLRIITSGGDYGIEIGGGAGGGAGTMLSEGDEGSTYTLNSSGFTASHAATDAAQTVGSIWLNPDWILDPIPPQDTTQMQISGGGTHVGDATYRFTRDLVTTQHSIIEMSIPLSIFGDEMIQNIIWRPSCGNDELQLMPSIVPVPEPSSLTLAVLAVVCLPLIHWHRRRKG
ncbi:MAG: hypothetical protein RJP95_00650 [Pirellulales bacterium]